MANGEVNCHQFAVEGGVVGLGAAEFFGEKCQRHPAAVDELLEHGAHADVAGVSGEGEVGARNGMMQKGC